LTNQTTLDLVIDTLNTALENNGHPRQVLESETIILHDTLLDSMGLAIAVLNLEETTGKDPFSDGFVNFQTVGDLAALYDM
jgi:acyl carrier protein